MARKRMVDPSIWTDEGMAALTARQQLLYIGLVSNADDDGRLRGSAVAVRLMLPTVLGEATVEEVEGDLRAVLGQMRKLCRYQHDGNTYLCFRNYARWQNINRPTPSRLPAPPADTVSAQASVPVDTTPLSEPSLSAQGQTRLREEKLEEESNEVLVTDVTAPDLMASAFDDCHSAFERLQAYDRGEPMDPEDAAAVQVMLDKAKQRHANGHHAEPIPDEPVVVPAETGLPPPWPDAAWIDQAFEQSFWVPYPRKTHKQPAKAAYRTLMRRQPTFEAAYALAATITEAICEQAEYWTDAEFTPHPASYLTARRWEDEHIVPTGHGARRR